MLLSFSWLHVWSKLMFHLPRHKASLKLECSKRCYSIHISRHHQNFQQLSQKLQGFCQILFVYIQSAWYVLLPKSEEKIYLHISPEMFVFNIWLVKILLFSVLVGKCGYNNITETKLWDKWSFYKIFHLKNLKLQMQNNIFNSVR